MVGPTESRTGDEVRKIVRARYAAGAQKVLSSGSCCGGSATDACCTNDPVAGSLYSTDEAHLVPADALAASLGCGNPIALAAFEPGETVLDLGSGGGIDVLLSARRVGPAGFAYGLDMTDEMLALAEKNRQEVGATNVGFLKGEIEAIPLPDGAVDVIISNCVINLAADKGPVLDEAFRVLKSGGRFAVSDVVTQGDLPANLRADMEARVGCVAGALEEREYRRLLAAAGFEDIDFQVTRVYDAGELAGTDGAGCCGPTEEPRSTGHGSARGRVVSAFIRARKPASA